MLVAAAPALAAPTGEEAVPAPAFQEAPPEDEHDVVPGTIWAIVGVGLACAGLGILYLLKRELGGFEPKPGQWEPPISVVHASDAAESESDYPPAPEGEHHAAAH